MKMQVLSRVVLLLLVAGLCSSQRRHGPSDRFSYSRGPVPAVFHVGSSYPSRSEEEECRPIRLRVTRGSRLFRTELVINTSPHIKFASADSRVMTSRMHQRLNTLAERYFYLAHAKIGVLRAWSEYTEGDMDPNSLHYEGRTVRVQVEDHTHYSYLLRLAVEVGFDWVVYESHDYVRLSVIPDACRSNIDLVFMLDQSGSVGEYNHFRALRFLHDVISFYNISSNATQVGLVTYSTYSHVEFDLDDFTDLSSVQRALHTIPYRAGWTATAWALFWARVLLNHSRGYGARPESAGIPRVAVLITDGRSNLVPIEPHASLLRESGVQVFTVGIGSVFLPELLHIASDPDSQHVFLLNSFSDAPQFVDFLSITTCDTPAIVTPGENTTTEVDEDQFRYFQSKCAAFSQTVMIEQIDIVGTCSLYASTTVQNPGPLSPHGAVVRNENSSGHARSVVLHLDLEERFIYVAVRGRKMHSRFSVIIWDMVFPQDEYEVRVPEGVAGSTLLDLNSLLLTENVTFNYSITEGNEAGYFSVGSQDGLISLLHPLSIVDRPPQSPQPSPPPSFLLTVSLQNSIHTCHRARVRVSVIVTRDMIQFPLLDPVSVSEDAEIGTEVAQVEVLGGGDLGVVYSLGGEGENLFEINPTTGVVTTASLELDFETQDRYNLLVIGTSTQTGLTGNSTLIVLVLDVNEQPFFLNTCARTPQEELRMCSFVVLENQPAGTTVDTLFGADPDLRTLPNGQFTFELLDSGATPSFEVVQRLGNASIVTTQSFDREATPTFSFVVRIADNGTPPLSSDVMVTVAVGDENDNPPVFSVAPPLLNVLESSGVGERVTQYIAMDRDIGENAEIRYSLESTFPSVPTSELPFSLDPSTGVLNVSGPLDFENTTIYGIVVFATNPIDGLQTNTSTLITIIDVNDNPPVFPREVVFAEIPEDFPPVVAVTMVTATDGDMGSNGRLVYSIVSGNAENTFEIGEESGIVSVRDPSVLDRETVPRYNLTVQASDMGMPSALSSTVSVVITVTDINDNSPVFTRTMYEVSLREDTPTPFSALNITAFDADQAFTPNSEIVFFLDSEGNVGNVFDLEVVDGNTATLVLTGELDFETRQFYELRVVATDQGNTPLSSSAVILVNVTDVNEFPPVIFGNQTIEVSEDEAPGALLAQINVTDLDAGSGMLRFAIVSVSTSQGVVGDAGLSLFSIDRFNGTVRLERPLDFETNNIYFVEIVVTDGVLFSMGAVLTVVVLDVNEFPPEVQDSFFSVQEEELIGTFVGTVIALDRDGITPGSPSALTFALVPDSAVSRFFAIDSLSGNITTRQVLDREELVQEDLFLPSLGSSETLRVEVSDAGSPPRSTLAAVQIQLMDINDNPPELPTSLSNPHTISEGPPAGEVIASVVAVDRDIGVNAQINYTLSVIAPASLPPSLGDIPFFIDEFGDLRTAAELDAEVVSAYILGITATDNGDPPMSDSAQVEVTVTDLNDNSPIFSQSVYDVSVPENTEVGVALEVLITAIDSDISHLNSDVTYKILSAFPPASINLFSIDPLSGNITIQGVLDFESTQVHNLTVQACDQGTPQLSTTVPVVVRVTNIDEVPPKFLAECSISILEEVEVSSGVFPIGECSATDVDEVTGEKLFGVPLTYEILDGNEDQIFDISSDGTVFVRGVADRERISFYSLVVRVTDPAGLTNTTFLNVTILDVNDNSPVVLNTALSRLVTLEEIRDGEDVFFDVNASDADVGINAEISYFLEGVGLANDGLSSTLQVRVADGGGLETRASIGITFEVPCFLQNHVIDMVTGIVKTRLLCSVGISPASLDVAVGGAFSISCSALSNLPVTFEFRHNGSVSTATVSGEGGRALSVAMATFEDAGEYSCLASTDIGVLQSMETVVRVRVPPELTAVPVDLAVSVSQQAIFTCIATGQPPPTITWTRTPISGGPEVTLTNDQTSRIFVDNLAVVIAPVRSEDAGTYTCTARNVVGVARASAQLLVAARSSVVQVELLEVETVVAARDGLGACHETNMRQFESDLSEITGLRVVLTEQQGDNLCDVTACSSSPCHNGASCSPSQTSPTGYVCTCPPGFIGMNCDMDLDECAEGLCQSGGTCENTPGSFMCSCPPGFTGHRCQYSDLCTSNPCTSDNEVCVHTVSNSDNFVCLDESALRRGQLLSVTLDSIDASTLGVLDDSVNSLLEEDKTESVSRRRRRKQAEETSEDDIVENGFVTVCEARFLPAPDEGQEEEAGLVWACPSGVPAPSPGELDEICRALYDGGLVRSCTSPSGMTFKPATPTLPSTNVTFSLFLVGVGGALLEAEATLRLLQAPQTRQQLLGLGYKVGVLSALVQPTVVPPTIATLQQATRGESVSSGMSTAMIAGIVVGGVLVAMVIVTLLLAIVIYRCTRARREGKFARSDTSAPEFVYHHDNSVGLSVVKDTPSDPPPSSLESMFDDPIYGSGFYVPPPTILSTPTMVTNPGYTSPEPHPQMVEKTTCSSAKKHSSPKRSKSNLTQVKSESTDDLITSQDVNGEFSDRKRRVKRSKSTFKEKAGLAFDQEGVRRSKSSLKKVKSESTNDLLASQDDSGDDYPLETPPTSPPPFPRHKEGEIIRAVHSGKDHTRQGAMGNTGQR